MNNQLPTPQQAILLDKEQGKVMARADREKLKKEVEKQAILEQIARDKAIRSGKPIEEFLEQPANENNINSRFNFIFEKMKKIYPILTPEVEKLKTCLSTIKIYIGTSFFLMSRESAQSSS